MTEKPPFADSELRTITTPTLTQASRIASSSHNAVAQSCGIISFIIVSAMFILMSRVTYSDHSTDVIGESYLGNLLLFFVSGAVSVLAGVIATTLALVGAINGIIGASVANSWKKSSGLIMCSASLIAILVYAFWRYLYWS